MPKQDTISDEKIVKFIRDYTAKKHYPPAIRDLYKIGFKSAAAVHHRIQRLVADGRLGYTPGIARSIYVKEA